MGLFCGLRGLRGSHLSIDTSNKGGETKSLDVRVSFRPLLRTNFRFAKTEMGLFCGLRGFRWSHLSIDAI